MLSLQREPNKNSVATPLLLPVFSLSNHTGIESTFPCFGGNSLICSTKWEQSAMSQLNAIHRPLTTTTPAYKVPRNNKSLSQSATFPTACWSNNCVGTTWFGGSPAGSGAFQGQPQKIFLVQQAEIGNLQPWFGGRVF